MLFGMAVVVLTTYADDHSVIQALRARACGFLTKDAGAQPTRPSAAPRRAHAPRSDRTHADRRRTLQPGDRRAPPRDRRANRLTQRDCPSVVTRGEVIHG